MMIQHCVSMVSSSGRTFYLSGCIGKKLTWKMQYLYMSINGFGKKAIFLDSDNKLYILSSSASSNFRLSSCLRL